MEETGIRFTQVNVNEPPPRSRRRHAKSRTGCENCKIRRIKCDERTPKCGACTRKGVNCLRDECSRFDASERSQIPLNDESSTPRSDSRHRHDKTTLVQPSGPNIDMLQMRLFFHFENHTIFTLVFGPVVWKACVSLALKVLSRLQVRHSCLT